ncbi:uncharacterized protein ASCRUDRAFT_78534 [Ascoidea rubescens DSM 1968]|uniref:YMR315W-like protein n=1 Tax=Ascoidea rubescens DSM 1968 TaxID=1344418 RepID=A0A1D2VPD1_9ASCO|nr:YMR315W-like protein [Ascoidea rubescens DSM 1968]ODV63427.1 YMR315W-like protein [Ascoidea rubescens DSM 1968]
MFSSDKKPKVLNVGIIGTGIFATETHLPTVKSIPTLKVVACFNRTKKKAEEFAKKANIDPKNVHNSIDELFANPEVDIIDALLPVECNLSIVEKAIQYNKPLCFEKPIANNLESAEKIVELCKNSKMPILVLENFIYHKAVEIVKKNLKKIGDLIAFTYNSTGPFNEDNKYLNTSWRQHPNHIGGFLSDGGVHQLAYLTEILGQIESISAHTKQVRKESGTDDILFSSLKLKNNDVIGTFTYGSAFGATSKSTYLKVYGTKGTLFFDFSPKNELPIIKLKLGEYVKDYKKEEIIEINNKEDRSGVKSEFLNFYESVINNDKSLLKSTPEKTFHHLAVIDAALKSSAADGASVKVECLA